jgi:glycosyltransferase involved in cell wall biosynthesis
MTDSIRIRPADPKISVVVPARNEARNLEIVLPKLPPVHEVILVDGNSKDDTIATAKRLLPDVKVVQQTRKGKGNALACGFEAVTGDIVVMFDADCSADADEIPAFVGALVAGADVAKGSRYTLGGGSDDITMFRSLGNRALNVISNALMGARYTDLCYGYNAFWADTLPKIDLLSSTLQPNKDGSMHWGDGFEIETILTCRWTAAKLAISEVPSHERLRVHGESNLNAVRDGFRVLKSIMHERRRAVDASRVAGRIVRHTPRAAGSAAVGVAPATVVTSAEVTPTEQRGAA